MKINQNYNDPRTQGLDKAQEAAAAQQARAGRSSHGGGAGVDEVSLSHLAGALQEALESSPERSAQIERLAADFAAGRLEVDSAETARSLVEDALGRPDPDGNS